MEAGNKGKMKENLSFKITHAHKEKMLRGAMCWQMSSAIVSQSCAWKGKQTYSSAAHASLLVTLLNSVYFQVHMHAMDHSHSFHLVVTQLPHETVCPQESTNNVGFFKYSSAEST